MSYFTQQISSETGVPVWFFTACKSGADDAELEKLVLEKIKEDIEKSPAHKGLYDDAFLAFSAQIISRTYKQWMQ